MNRLLFILIAAGLISACAGVAPQGNGVVNAVTPGSGAVTESSDAKPATDLAPPPATDPLPAPETPPAPATPYSARFENPASGPMGSQPLIAPRIGPIAAADGPQAGGVFSPVAEVPGIGLTQAIMFQVGEGLPQFLTSAPETVQLSEYDALHLAFNVSSEIRLSRASSGTSVIRATQMQVRLIHTYVDGEGTVRRRVIDAMAGAPREDGCNVFFNLPLPQAGRLNAYLAIDSQGIPLPTSDFSAEFRDLTVEADYVAAKRGFLEFGELILQRMGAKEAATVREGNDAANSVLQDPTQGLPTTQPPMRDRPRNLLNP